ncbi:MAG: leucyl aminopeptidase [Candidatus Saganbacteria bacterium]|nr:leucyl aminopeptidase [Candidatus Saganbacteria bacterium]
MKINIENSDLLKQKCDVLVVNVFEGVEKPSGAAAAADKALGGRISELISSKEITGKTGTVTVIHTPAGFSARHVLIVGLGKKAGFGLDRIREAAASAVRTAKKIKAKKIVTVVHGSGEPGIVSFDACKALVEASLLSEYDFEGYKTDKKEDIFKIEEKVIVDNDKKKVKEFRKAAAISEIICEAVNDTRDLVNIPSNMLTPSVFAKKAQKIAAENGLECNILGKQEILKMGMGALWSVAKGSREEPKVVVLKYFGAGKNKPLSLALIGKGITFDSGGISLKPAKKMHEMKGDMAGAAAVLCSMEAASKLKIKKNILAVMPLTENMPGGIASKPGDVVKSLSGKTIEIINTDAEGRMILADAVTYAKKLGVTKILDVATLTGGCIVALGDAASGILGNDRTFIRDVITAGGASGEKLWQLPLYEEYEEYLKSDIADIKNASDLGKASTSSGATFIKKFVEDTPWVHIDIAGTADLDRKFRHFAKGPSGAGVLTILNYLLK